MQRDAVGPEFQGLHHARGGPPSQRSLEWYNTQR